jgi:Holliday junction resolvasome RuvABC ATP-dependent DNA helicase subunit
MNPEQRLDYLYKEYVRLSQQAEEYIRSAFEDFKLMGVIGATIAL